MFFLYLLTVAVAVCGAGGPESARWPWWIALAVTIAVNLYRLKKHFEESEPRERAAWQRRRRALEVLSPEHRLALSANADTLRVISWAETQVAAFRRSEKSPRERAGWGTVILVGAPTLLFIGILGGGLAQLIIEYVFLRGHEWRSPQSAASFNRLLQAWLLITTYWLIPYITETADAPSRNERRLDEIIEFNRLGEAPTPPPAEPSGADQPLWHWHSGVTSVNYEDWMRHAQDPAHLQQAEEAIRDGHLQRWLSASGQAGNGAPRRGSGGNA